MLDNEELYFTKRLNGSVTDEDVEKAEKELRKYIKWIEIQGFLKAVNDTNIETIINELKYKKEKIKELEEKLEGDK